MNALDEKINQHFPGLVVRKDLVKTVKGNAIVPSYVLEYLLGQYCATSDEESIQSGIESVKEILRKHYVNRGEAGLVRSTIRERGQHKVIDKVSVALNDKRDVYEATFSNLGIKDVLVDADTVKRHPKLLVSGVWCIADLSYEHTENKQVSPWILETIKPIQLSHFDFDAYVEARRQFTADEWVDLLIQSMGFNPEFFGRRSKLMQLVRLIPYCERNFNLIELGPKGHRQVAHLLRVLAARHPHLRWRGDGAQAVRQQLQRADRAGRLLGYGRFRRIRGAHEAGGSRAGGHPQELHGEQVVLARHRDAGR